MQGHKCQLRSHSIQGSSESSIAVGQVCHHRCMQGLTDEDITMGSQRPDRVPTILPAHCMQLCSHQETSLRAACLTGTVYRKTAPPGQLKSALGEGPPPDGLAGALLSSLGCPVGGTLERAACLLDLPVHHPHLTLQHTQF